MLAVALYDVQASHMITAVSIPNVDFGLVNQVLFGERREIQKFQRIIHGFEVHERNRQRSDERNRLGGDERKSKRPFPPSHHPSPRSDAYAHIVCLIKYPAKPLYLTRRVPARDQNDGDQEHNDFEELQKPEQQAGRPYRDAMASLKATTINPNERTWNARITEQTHSPKTRPARCSLTSRTPTTMVKS